MVMFGIESFGTFAKEGKDFVKACARLTVFNNNNNNFYSVVLRHMIQRISIALQIANFKAIAKLINVNSSSLSNLSLTSTSINFPLVSVAIFSFKLKA